MGRCDIRTIFAASVIVGVGGVGCRGGEAERLGDVSIPQVRFLSRAGEQLWLIVPS